jgi:hypothetical protein
MKQKDRKRDTKPNVTGNNPVKLSPKMKQACNPNQLQHDRLERDNHRCNENAKQYFVKYSWFTNKPICGHGAKQNNTDYANGSNGKGI